MTPWKAGNSFRCRTKSSVLLICIFEVFTHVFLIDFSRLFTEKGVITAVGSLFANALDSAALKRHVEAVEDQDSRSS